MKVTSGEVELAVRTWGAPGRPPIVLLHGYPDTSAVWDATAARLEADHHVIAYDVRGHGASTAPATAAGYRLEHLMEDLAAVIDATSPGHPVHLVGHDWGSIAGWEAAATLAGRLASFTSISGPGLDHMGHWLRDHWRAHDYRVVAGQLARSWYISAFQLPGAPLVWRLGLGRAWPRVLRRVEGVTTEGDRTREGVNGMELYRVNFGERLRHPRDRSTDLPVQLIVPTRDRYVGPHLLDDVARWAPRVVRREVDAGHWLPLERPDALAALLIEWIRDR